MSYKIGIIHHNSLSVQARFLDNKNIFYSLRNCFNKYERREA